MAIKNEIQIRTKALQEKDFPSTQIIHEFKKKLDPPKTFDRSWRQPNIVKFVVSCDRVGLIAWIFSELQFTLPSRK